MTNNAANVEKTRNHPMFGDRFSKRVFDIQSEFTPMELAFIKNAINRLAGHTEPLDIDDVPFISLDWLRSFVNRNQSEFFEAGKYLCLIISSKTKI